MQFYSLRAGNFIISVEASYTNLNYFLINSSILP